MHGHAGAVEYDYLVLGAGPAGLQLGYYLARAGRSYLILEAGDSPGTSFKQFPRHRKLISINKVYTGYDDQETNMRWDWNSLLTEEENPLLLKQYSRRYFPQAEDFVQYLADFAERYDINVRYNTRATRVEKRGAFHVHDQDGNHFIGRRLIVATGVSLPYVPQVPGIELAENYVDVSVDPEDFVNQKVLVVGKGNSGFETADALVETASVIHVLSPNPLRLAWKTHFVGHLRAVNNNLLDTYQLKCQNAILDANIESIERRADGTLDVKVQYTHACGESEVLNYDRVIFCTGFRFDASIFHESCRPELVINSRFPAQTSEWESVNVPGLYFAGTITQARDFKRTASGFIHGFRYNARSLTRILDRKYYGKEWVNQEIEATPEGYVDAVMARVNRSSALWQQFGFLCDVIAVPEDGGTARYFEEMPLDYAKEHLRGEVYTITLEFGKITGDPFDIQRNPTPEAAHESVFLHPVIRRWSEGALISEHHMLEDLGGEWKKLEPHIVPLYDYFAAQVRESVAVA